MVPPPFPLFEPVPVPGFGAGVVVPPLTVNFCPTKIMSDFKLFQDFKFATETPCLLAMLHNESPALTV